MLEQLIQAGKQQLSGKLSETAGLNTSQIDDSFGVAQNSMVETFKNEALGGNISGLLSLFNGKSAIDTSNPIVNNFVGSFTSGIITKLGLPEGTAKIITDTVVPFLMQKFASKETGSATDAGDLLKMIGIEGNGLEDIAQNLLGGGGSDLLKKGLGGFFK